MPISHHAYLPSYLLAILPISYHAYQQLYLLIIMPVSHHAYLQPEIQDFETALQAFQYYL